MYTLAPKQVCGVSARPQLLPAGWQVLCWHLLFLGCPCGAAPCWAVPATVLAWLRPWGQRAALPAAGCAAVSLPCQPSLPLAAHRGTGTWCRVPPLCQRAAARGSGALAGCSRAPVTASPAGSAPRPRCGGQCLRTAICFPKAVTGDRGWYKLLRQERLKKEINKGLVGTEPFHLFA